MYEFIEYVRPEDDDSDGNGDGTFDMPDVVKEGERDETMFRFACSERAHDRPKAVTMAAALEYNRTCFKPPLSESEVRKKVESAYKHKPGFSDEVKAKKGKASADDDDSSQKRGKSFLTVSRALIDENSACFIDGVPALFINGRYETGWKAIDKGTLSIEPNANSSKRREVREYIDLMAPSVEASPPELVGFANGVLDISTMRFRDYEKSDIIQCVIPHKWIPYAEAPLVDMTLKKLAAGDPNIELNLTEFMGLCLYRSNELAYFPFLLGKRGKNASNGKSTYIKMIRSMLGSGNFSSLSFNDLGQNFLKRFIAGKLANLGDDISSKQIDANALETVKKAATGDRIFCDVKNGPGFEFDSFCTFIFSSNKIPRFEDEDGGLNRRMFPLRFNGHFTRDDPDFDPRIGKKLATEESCQRMLVRAVDGLRRCRGNDGPTPNEDSKKMLEEIKTSNNSILQWMDYMDKSPNDLIGCIPSPVFDDYKDWCSKSGISKPYGLPGFGRALVDLFGIESHTVKENGKPVRRYRYIEE